jgi:hypothetical protein
MGISQQTAVLGGEFVVVAVMMVLPSGSIVSLKAVTSIDGPGVGVGVGPGVGIGVGFGVGVGVGGGGTS